MQELQVEPMTEKNYTQTALTIFLVSLLVVGAFAPFTAGIASAEDGDDSDSDAEICDEFQTVYDAFSEEKCIDKINDKYSNTANLGGLYGEITKEDFFSTSHPTGGEETYTQWAAIGDIAFRYAHFYDSDENQHNWELQMVKFSDENQNGKIDSGELTGFEPDNLKVGDDKMTTSLQGTSFQLNRNDKAVTYTVDTHDEASKEYAVDADASFLKNLMKGEDMDPSKYANSGGSTDDTQDSIDEILSGATDSSDSASGSVVDYNLQNHQPVSVYVSRFKDSSTTDEAFEYRSMPPLEGQAAGDVSDFQNMMGESGKAKISGNGNGLYAGFGIFRVPDSQTGTATLVIESAGGNGHGNSDATVKIVNRDGKVFKSTDLQRSITMPSDAVEYANNNNAVYVIIEGDENSDIAVSCISVVTNTDSAKSCDAGEVQTQAPQLGQSDDTSTDDTSTDTSTNSEGTSGDILNYDISKTTYSESIDYTSGFADGDSQSSEYFETAIPLNGEPAGDVQNYPQMMDSNPATAATFSASESGLNTALSADGVPLGKNHVFVMTYKVSNGEAPTVYLHTPNGERVRVPQSKLTVGGVNTVAVSVPTELSKSMNRYGSAYITVSSETSTTEFEVYCASFIANPQNTDNIKCSGTSQSGGASVQSLSTNVKTQNTKPTAKVSAPDKNIEAGEETTFAAKKAGSDVQSYTWTVTSSKLDGAIKQQGRTLKTKFVESGQYNVKLTVTDIAGNTDTTTKTVDVGKATTTIYKWDKVVPKTKIKVAQQKPGENWTKGSLVRTEDAVSFTRKILQKKHIHGHDHDKEGQWNYKKKHIHTENHWHSESTSWQNMEYGGANRPNGDVRNVDRDVRGHDHDEQNVWHGSHRRGHDHDRRSYTNCYSYEHTHDGYYFSYDHTHRNCYTVSYGHDHDTYTVWHGSHEYGHEHDKKERYTYEDNHTHRNTHWHDASTSWSNLEKNGMPNKPSGSDVKSVSKNVKGHDHDKSIHKHYDRKKVSKELDDSSISKHMHGQSEHFHGLPSDTLMNTVEETSVKYYEYSKDYTVTKSQKSTTAPSSYDSVKGGTAGVTSDAVKCDTLREALQKSASDCTVDSKETGTNTDGDGKQTNAISKDELKNTLQTDYGMQYSVESSYTKFSESADDGAFATAIRAPSNNGEVAVDIAFEAKSFESSGIIVYAVDTEGDTKVIKCDSGVNSPKLPDVNCDSGDKGSNFNWAGEETVSMDAEIDEVVVMVDMENVLGKYYDTGRFYYLTVTEDSEEK